MQRREFVVGTLAAASAGAYLGNNLSAGESPPSTHTGAAKMPFEQPPLPYPMDGLKPLFSEEQVSFHYGKHHAAYFKNLNGLVEGKPEAQMSLDDLVVKGSGAIFNNAAQAWNHTFFWNCLSPAGGREPNGELLAAIVRDFGGMAEFRKLFTDASVKVFGSGWGWLASDKQGKLEIIPAGNADNPLRHGKAPLLTVDVWEHAYYIDYRNERARFVENFWTKVNWDFVAQCYAKAKA